MLVDYLLRCQACRGILTMPKRGPIPTYCGNSCWAKVRRRPAKISRQCLNCNAPFDHLKADAKYCSDKCRIDHRSRRQTNVCEVCYRFFKTGNGTAQTCSKRCRVLFHSRIGASPRTCLVCGDSFEVDRYHATQAKYCSVRCRERSANKLKNAYRSNWHRQRRIREQESEVEKINPFVVFDRDNWICWLCNTPCDRDASHPQPLAATVDHVVPVSKGGLHRLGNLRCAHAECNTRRGNRDPAGLVFHRPSTS